MTIPTFKRRRKFLDDLEVPCLWASLPNSSVPGLAAKHIESHVEEPHFDIFLRGRKPAKTSAWQKKILERLLVKGGLATAIEEGMKDYYMQHDESDFTDRERLDIQDMKRNGVLPYFVLSSLVVDDSQRKVLLVLQTDSDANLAEHGAVIYLDRDAWRFDSDYVYDYLNDVEEEESNRQSDDFEEEPDDAGQAASPEAVDIGPVLGQWLLDDAATRDYLQRKGDPEDEIGMCIRSFSGKGFELTEKHVYFWWKNRQQTAFGSITRIRQRGNKTAITYTDSSEKDSHERTWEMILEDGHLFLGGLVYSRTQDLNTAWKKT